MRRVRVCFQMQVVPERIAEYTERHAAVWPEMLEAIADAGRRNYSLFLRGDGLLIGTYETDDDEAAQRALAADPRTAAWEREMAEFFVASSGRPDQEAPRLAEVFNLEDQLARHRASTRATAPRTTESADHDHAADA